MSNENTSNHKKVVVSQVKTHENSRKLIKLFKLVKIILLLLLYAMINTF